MSRGPSSSARVLAAIASPGRSPLEMARLASGARTELDSTNAIDPGPSMALATARATRSPPTNTDSKLFVHASSGVSITVPVGGPPTEIRAPSSAAPGVDRGAAPAGRRSPGRRCRRPGRRRCSPSSATAASRVSSLRPESTHPGALGDEQVDGGAAQAAAPHR